MNTERSEGNRQPNTVAKPPSIPVWPPPIRQPLQTVTVRGPSPLRVFGVILTHFMMAGIGLFGIAGFVCSIFLNPDACPLPTLIADGLLASFIGIVGWIPGMFLGIIVGMVTAIAYALRVTNVVMGWIICVTASLLTVTLTLVCFVTIHPRNSVAAVDVVTASMIISTWIASRVIASRFAREF